MFRPPRILAIACLRTARRSVPATFLSANGTAERACYLFVCERHGGACLLPFCLRTARRSVPATFLFANGTAERACYFLRTLTFHGRQSNG
jgi:hypothetical protein